jgi:hypothetical protein
VTETHALIVRRHRHGHLEYTLECLDGSGACLRWREDCCPESQARPEWGYDNWFGWTGRTDAHGVEHGLFDGVWMKNTGRCMYVGHPQLVDTAAAMRLKSGVPLYPGRYPVQPRLCEGRIELRWHGAGRVRMEGDLYHGKVPDGAVYIGRSAPGLPASYWANPFKPQGQFPDGSGRRVGDVQHAIELFGELAHARPGFVAAIRRHLPDRLLACWCKPHLPCHGDWLVQTANAGRPV